jgi:heme O synthase-like polyprenyltransferase
MQTVVETKLSVSRRLAAFFHLCKPRVNSLIVFTAMIGMFLATPGFPPLLRFAVASIGIALVAFAAAALNCLVERTIDARMARTRGSRPGLARHGPRRHFRARDGHPGDIAWRCGALAASCLHQ